MPASKPATTQSKSKPRKPASPKVRQLRKGRFSIDAFAEALVEHKGSDLLLTAGAPALLRIDGELRQLDDSKFTPVDIEDLVLSILSPDQEEEFRREFELDFSFNWEGKARFRANAFMQRGSMALSLRLIPFGIPNMEELQLPEAVQKLTTLRQGLVLVTGPTGSGKSTTLAAMIDAINSRRACHILTVEDPIEYLHNHKRSAVNQREVGGDTHTFTRALRAALREDPDVLLVGEMRDLETIQIALTVAETGHLVFATLHTNDTAQSLDRIVDVFPGDRQTQIRVQLAASLSGIVYQQLVPRIGGGRVGAYEVMLATSPIRNLIKEGKTFQLRNQISTGRKQGMQTLEHSLSELIDRGVITLDDALARSLYPNELPLAKRR